MTRVNLRSCCSSATLAWALAMAIASAATSAVAAGQTTGTGAEGIDANAVIVTAERNRAAATAPTKASLTQTQPEAIISHQFIENFTPETGDYTTVVLIAPSLSGISSNGGGVGETNKITMRGFSDGEYNITYDGIFYGDTNNPTHHPASFFPASTIGAAVVDRGPGAAGDLGQANYGGAIHFFSPNVENTFGGSQKLTYGSFNTWDFVSRINTGELAKLGGTKILLNFDEHISDGQLSSSSGYEYNQLIKIIVPVGATSSLTLFATHNLTHFYQADAGPGETWQQVLAYGKNFALNGIPTDEHYFGFNHQQKETDFEYVDFKSQVSPTIALEDQAYTYYYKNGTIAANDITGLVGGVNTSPPNQKSLPKTDIGGYDKGNEYRVYGDIFRINKDWSFGSLKAGVLVEASNTYRHNLLLDLTQGVVDNKFTSPPLPLNAKTLEYSSWFQYQLFADFEWKPTDQLTITPGFKWVDLTRHINGVVESTAGGGEDGFAALPKFRASVVGSNTYRSPLYFLTVNYRIRPDWSVYAQYATGFLIPQLSTLQSTQLQLNALKPQTSVNYQIGTVYTHGHVTLDLDAYEIKLSNFAVPDPTGQFEINAGEVEFNGVEAEGAYAFDWGLTLFANGSWNHGVNLTGHVEVAGEPEWTAAVGALYTKGPWAAAVTVKGVGPQVSNDVINLPPTPSIVGAKLPAYGTVDGTLAYDFGHFKIKLAGINLLDNRAVTSFTQASGHPTDALFTTANPDLYTFQAGRQFLVTIEAKY